MSTPMNMEEQQPPAKKSRMDDPSSSKEEPAEIAIQHDGATSEVQIRELEISKKGELNALELEKIAFKDEFAEKLASLEKKHQMEIAELELKTQKLTEENKAFEAKLKKLEEMIQTNKQKIGEAETEIMVSIREMKIQLPTENWHDLLAFVPRKQLGNVVSQIGDRQFAKIIQSFLHDPVRKITLGKMRIIAPRPYVPSDQLMVMVKVGRKVTTTIPDWPMPGNIKDFKEIVFNSVDTSFLHFLGKFQENSLLTDVNMCFDYENSDNDVRILDEIPRVLTKIAPFITSFESITSWNVDLFYVVYDWPTEYSQLLLIEMMAKTRCLLTNWNRCEDNDEEWENKMNWCCTWLYTPRNDGKPRMLRSDREFYLATDCTAFIERIKKDFEMAKNPVSFFIKTSIDKNDTVEDISFENAKTNEKLVIKKIKMKSKYSEWKVLLISRYPLNAAKNWIEANENEISEWIKNEWKLNRKISLDGELTIEM